MNSAAAFTRLKQFITGYREDMIAMQRELLRRVAMGRTTLVRGRPRKPSIWSRR